ncbi:hypothetical protein [Blautia producta]|uniref:hypothetical protein n=1 Tax=Blautia producta TaxID=33035 RepID=UPI00356996FA
MTDFNKEIWEGWTVGAFIESLQIQVEMIMTGQSWQKPFESKAELSKWCTENQPYYKKKIPAVVNYFAEKYSL